MKNSFAAFLIFLDVCLISIAAFGVYYIPHIIPKIMCGSIGAMGLYMTVSTVWKAHKMNLFTSGK